MRSVARRQDFGVGGVAFSHEQIVAQRAVEQIGLLGGDAQPLPHRVGAICADVIAADAYFARVGIPKTRENVHERRFARAARAAQNQTFAMRNIQTHVVERARGVRRVRQSDVAQFNVEVRGRGEGLRRVGRGRGRVNQFKQTPRGGLTGFELLKRRAQGLRGFKTRHRRERQEREKNALHRALRYEGNGERQNGQTRQAGQQRRQGVTQAAPMREPQLRVVHLFAQRVGLLREILRLRKCQRVGEALNLIRQARVPLRARRNQVLGWRATGALCDEGQNDADQKRKERERQGKRRIERANERARARGDEDGGERRHENANIKIFQRFNVSADARQDVAAVKRL
ncbi:MAG: hypothetical protein HDKAJFGB_02115 [Anaerolineae bacterium]|nr:hypothetical protein [Anaerolineae bacterium]